MKQLERDEISDALPDVQGRSVITFPKCGHAKDEIMR
jgi:hypothetical protein